MYDGTCLASYLLDATRPLTRDVYIVLNLDLALLLQDVMWLHFVMPSQPASVAVAGSAYLCGA